MNVNAGETNDEKISTSAGEIDVMDDPGWTQDSLPQKRKAEDDKDQKEEESPQKKSKPNPPPSSTGDPFSQT